MFLRSRIVYTRLWVLSQTLTSRTSRLLICRRPVNTTLINDLSVWSISHMWQKLMRSCTMIKSARSMMTILSAMINSSALRSLVSKSTWYSWWCRQHVLASAITLTHSLTRARKKVHVQSITSSAQRWWRSALLSKRARVRSEAVLIN